MLKYNVKGYFVLIIFIFISCAGISPHENFKSVLNSQIGKSIDNAPTYSFRSENGLISSKILPNGNIENKYKYYREGCVYFFEIDPKTRKIVGTRFEGDESDCILNP